MKTSPSTLASALVLTCVTLAPALAQDAAPVATSPQGARAQVPAGVSTTPDYVIGPDDVLTIVFWRDKDMSNDVVVRPDGMVSLPLINDVHASGLTPDQLRVRLTEAAGKFVEDPNITIVVKAINSRRVYITGQVSKPGPYPLVGPLTVLQLIATAGGVLEYSKSEEIQVLLANGKFQRFNYKDVAQGKNLQQNIQLKPGDTVIVP